MKHPPSLLALIRELSRLPGIGPKSAQRLAFHLFEQPREDIERLASALLEAKRDLHVCPICFNITDAEKCDVCADTSRDQRTICVVEEPGDVIAIERSGEYRGLYHVLHGVLSPMNGVGPDKLHIKPLLPRVQEGMEVILATGTTVEGDATALYLQRLLEPLGAANPDPLDLPDAVLTRPSLVAIFDSIRHEIVLVAAAYADNTTDAEAAY